MSDAIARMEKAGVLDPGKLTEETRNTINQFFADNEGAEQHLTAFYKHLQNIHPDNKEYVATPNHSGVLF